MLDLDLVAIFSVAPAGSGVGCQQTNKQSWKRKEPQPYNHQKSKSKAISLKWKLLSPRREREWERGWDCKEWEKKQGVGRMEEARQTITNSHN